MILTTEQMDAVMGIVEWWENDRQKKQIYVVAGYAGVGKSSTVKSAIESLQINPDRVGYITFTGKAALVLQMMGQPAQTIHSMIYEPILGSYLDKPTGIKKSRVAGFKLTTMPLHELFDLFVIDEVSMVSAKLLFDVVSFGVPILALGDPAQLPPVMGIDNKLLQTPDVFLKEIHRQAADNPILWASMLAREGRPIPYGHHGDNLLVIPAYQVNTEMLMESDQNIVCTHKRRALFNHKMRAAQGFSGLPRMGEKLICLKNNKDEFAFGDKFTTTLVNGLLLRLCKEIEPEDVYREERVVFLSMGADHDSTAQFLAIESNLDYFEPIPERPANTDGRLDSFDFGGTITCHKGQGSSFESVVYVNDGFGDWIQQRQLLYTGITRASKKLVLGL